MTLFINSITGGEMWVADDRIGEYLAAGHKPAASLLMEKPVLAKHTEIPVDEAKPAKKTTKRIKK